MTTPSDPPPTDTGAAPVASGTGWVVHWVDETAPADGRLFDFLTSREFRDRMNGEFAGALLQTRPSPEPDVYTVTPENWATIEDPLRLAHGLPDIGKPLPYRSASPTTYRVLAAELFRQIACGVVVVRPSCVDEFADELLRAKWLESDLLGDWHLRRDRPPEVRRLFDCAAVGPMSHAQWRIARAFLVGRTEDRANRWPHSTVRTPCSRAGLIDLLTEMRFLFRQTSYREPGGRVRPTFGALDFGVYCSSRACHLIRESFRGPGRWPAFRSAWRTDTVLALRKQMWDRHQLGATPILADALQDAGCDDEGLLSHLRRPGCHSVGCWALAAIDPPVGTKIGE